MVCLSLMLVLGFYIFHLAVHLGLTIVCDGEVRFLVIVLLPHISERLLLIDRNLRLDAELSFLLVHLWWLLRRRLNLGNSDTFILWVVFFRGLRRVINCLLQTFLSDRGSNRRHHTRGSWTEACRTDHTWWAPRPYWLSRSGSPRPDDRLTCRTRTTCIWGL